MKLHLVILDLEGEFLTKDVDLVNVATAAGELTILANHQPLITSIKISHLYYILDGEQVDFAIAGGTLFVSEKECKIITSAIEEATKIDFERAESALERAKKRLEEKANDIDFMRAEAALKRAINRLSFKK